MPLCDDSEDACLACLLLSCLHVSITIGRQASLANGS